MSQLKSKSMTRIVRILVTPENSTVNGRKPDSKHDAAEWLDGWKNLGLTDPLVYKDGVLWEYLHVPVLGPNADGKWYRVRCKYTAVASVRTHRTKYKGRLVNAITVERRAGRWFWNLDFGMKRLQRQ